MYTQIGLAGLLLYLAAAAQKDIREKKVSLHLAAVFAALALIWRGAGMTGAEDLFWTFCGLIPGSLMLLGGRFTREAIGYGDAIAVLVTGLFQGFRGSAEIVIIGLMLSCPFSLFLLVIKGAPKNREIPFIPFLLAAYMVYLPVR